MLDRGDRAVLQPARDERARERTKEPLGYRFDDAVQRGQTKKRDRCDRRSGGCCRRRRRKDEPTRERARRHDRQHPDGTAAHHDAYATIPLIDARIARPTIVLIATSCALE